MYVVSAVQRGGGPIPGRLSELSESRTARLAQGAQPWSYYGQDGVEARQPCNFAILASFFAEFGNGSAASKHDEHPEYLTPYRRPQPIVGA
jgi:hypothetical protein